jgi:hypothetical protein
LFLLFKLKHDSYTKNNIQIGIHFNEFVTKQTHSHNYHPGEVAKHYQYSSIPFPCPLLFIICSLYSPKAVEHHRSDLVINKQLEWHSVVCVMPDFLHWILCMWDFVYVSNTSIHVTTWQLYLFICIFHCYIIFYDHIIIYYTTDKHLDCFQLEYIFK